MDDTFHIPDDLAAGIAAFGTDLSRRALGSLRSRGTQAKRITKAQLSVLGGLERMEIDGFLKAHNVYEGFTLEEVEMRVAALERLGI